MKEDREWTLNNVEQICVNTKDIDEICFGLEQLTIFATENIQDFATTILKLQTENQQLKEQLKDENTYHEEAVKWYKEAFELEQERIKLQSTLEEIRKWTKSVKYTTYELIKDTDMVFVSKNDLKNLLQIIDKCENEVSDTQEKCDKGE